MSLNSPKLRQSQYAKWEKSFNKVMTPLEDFIHKETSSGVLLMLFTVIALILANSPFADSYQAIFQTHLSISLGEWTLDYSLHHWINDGLMALFFFVVGLEIKREVLVGELSSMKQAMLPIIAAIGGMVVPALFYYSLNLEGAGVDGWGIPMATDIAFAVGVLVLLGKRLPLSLLTFLLALAIADDLGAVLVIAIFYTEQVHVTPLLVAFGLWFFLFGLNLSGVRYPLPYFLIGTLIWLAMLKSGIHATLAGVLTAFTIPAHTRVSPKDFYKQVINLMNLFKNSKDSHENLMRNQEQRGIVHTLENGILAVEPPLQRLEDMFHLPVAFIVIPLFALANAGIPLHADSFMQTLQNPATLGVMVGLVLGKLTGIAGVSWVAVRLGIADWPAGTSLKHIIGVGLLGGIGFTMSIFIAELAFVGQEEMLIMAKTGVLMASLIAGITGYLWLFFATKKPT